jgi:TPR repeat protein
MKTTRCGFVFGLFLLVGLFQLQAADPTNTPPFFPESWQTISNRWGSVPLEKIKQAAEQADVSAQYYLAMAYSDGNRIEKDEKESLKWMQMAAAQGRPQAQRKLGWMFQNGLGTGTNMEEAAKWYGKAAGQGDSMAQNNLGYLYKNGWGVAENPAEAVKWFEKSAEQGEKLAAENLAWIYAAGVYGPSNTFGQGAEAQIKSGGFAPNHELAEKWMRKALDLNSAEGQFRFAKLLHSEFNDKGIEDNARFSEAAEWYRKAAEQGLAKAQYYLAEMYNSGELGDDQRSKCIPWYLKAAAQGNAEAQAEISKLHAYYPNSELLKSVNLVDNLKQAAGQDNLNAQFDLAWRYHHGDGVPKDDTEAFKWMEKAAQHDVSPVTKTIDAHYYLGVIYETGQGVTKNLTNAYRLYQEAAVGGTKPEPFVRLGQMYEKGEGVPQDDRLAATNYFIATQFGFFPTSDDTARCTTIENLLNLYVQGRGLPDDKSLVGRQLNVVKQSPITTAKGQFLVGEIYFQGKLVPQDLVEAAAWIRLAANKNFEDAHYKLDQVEFLMSSAQKEAAKDRFDSLDKLVGEAKKSYEQYQDYRRSHSW